MRAQKLPPSESLHGPHVYVSNCKPRHPDKHCQTVVLSTWIMYGFDVLTTLRCGLCQAVFLRVFVVHWLYVKVGLYCCV